MWCRKHVRNVTRIQIHMVRFRYAKYLFSILVCFFFYFMCRWSLNGINAICFFTLSNLLLLWLICIYAINIVLWLLSHVDQIMIWQDGEEEEESHEIEISIFVTFNVQLFTLRTDNLIKINDLTSQLDRIICFIWTTKLFSGHDVLARSLINSMEPCVTYLTRRIRKCNSKIMIMNLICSNCWLCHNVMVNRIYYYLLLKFTHHTLPHAHWIVLWYGDDHTHTVV